MILGLDVDKNKSVFTLLEEDGETIHSKGTVTLSTFQALLKEHKPKAAGIEYTGRLAEPWIELATEHGTPIYIIHSVDRNAHNRIARQVVKNDPRDSRSIAETLSVWIDPYTRKLAHYPNDLFTEASTIRIAWQLRAILSSVTTLTRERTKAKQRADAAKSCGNEPMYILWTLQAKSELPEQALETALAFTKNHFPKEYAALKAIHGVGDSLACHAIATLLPIEKFPDVNRCLSYVGLRAIENSSGGKDITKPRTKSYLGQPELRSLLYMSIVSEIGLDGIPDKANPQGKTSEFYTIYHRLRERGKPHMVAYVACMSHRLRHIYAVLLRGTSRELEALQAKRPNVPPNAHTQTEAAKLLGVSRQAIADRIKRGTLTTTIINGKTYVLDVAPPPEKPLDLSNEAIEAAFDKYTFHIPSTKPEAEPKSPPYEGGDLERVHPNEAEPLFEQTPAGLQTVIPN